MAERLSAGDRAPKLVLTSAVGKQISLSDFSGQRVVVYFYPAAATPGCTKQACDFRDSLASLTAAGYQVLGVSPDDVGKLERFAADEDLTFPLLSDPDHSAAEEWGAWGEKKNYGKVYVGLIRSTVVVDEDGRVLLAQYNVRATGHVAKLKKDLGLS